MTEIDSIEEEVDFNNIPAPPNPNERIIYFNCPPLKIELGDAGDKIIVTKILENSIIDVPIGSILTHINDDDVTSKSSVDCLKILRKWNKSGPSGSPMLLKFLLNTNFHEISGHSHLMGFDPVKSILLRDIADKSKTVLGIALHSSFAQKICNLHGWEPSVILPRLERLMQDYLQLKSHYTSPLAASSSTSSTTSSPSATTTTFQSESNPFAGETDILDCIKATKGGPALPVDTDDDYVVSLLSRQLGMTIENILERTIVRLVHPNSEAFRLNVRVNSIILNIGSASTLHQTHLETIESLKNTVRPVKLRLCKIDENMLAPFRAEMHSLVSKSKSQIDDLTLHFSALERQTLWIFEIYALAECLASCQLENSIHTRALAHTTSSEHDHDHEHDRDNERDGERERDSELKYENEINSLTAATAGVTVSENSNSLFTVIAENTFCRKRAQICLDRALKILDAYELTRQSFLENDRRGNMYPLRWTSLTEAMYDIRETFDWNSNELYLTSGADDATPFHLPSMTNNIIDVAPVDLVAETLRNITLSLLQLSSEQQEQQIFPDRATCDVLDRIVRNTMTPTLLLNQHIPALWKLAGSAAVPARIACANLIPLIYCHLSSLQRLRIRGLLNRLLVDPVSEVRAYVLSSVCVRIMRSIVTKKISEKFIEPESITLNWISHCMVQGSTDIEMDMRKAALLLCKNMVEYSSLGQNDGVEVNSIVQEMQTYLSDDRAPPSFSPESVVLPSISDIHIMFCRAHPIISRLVEDNEAEIRGSVVSMCGDFCIWMGGKWSAVLLDVLLCCFRDSIPEVRASALTAVPHAVLALIQAAIKSTHDNTRDQTISKLFISLIPAVCSMQKDTHVIVRIALCKSLGQVLSLMYSITLTGHLRTYSFIPSLQATMCSIVLSLLDDKINQVTIQMIAELCLTIDKEYQYGYNSYISLIFTEENLLPLIRCSKYLSKLPSWRVRKLICTVIPKLVNTCKTVENRSLVSDVITPLLYDPIFAVRQAAATAMCIASMSDYFNDTNDNEFEETNQTTTGSSSPSSPPPPSSSSMSMSSPLSFTSSSKDKKSSSKKQKKKTNMRVTSNGEPVQDMGRMWLDCVVLPQLESLRTSKIFSNRILSLHMIATLLFEEIVQRGDVRYHILINIALTLSHDPVPNVRIALGEVLGVLAQLLKRDDGNNSKSINNNTNNSMSSAATSQQQQQQIWDITIETLNLLSNDQDKDVQHYAKTAKEYLQTGKIHQAKTKISLICQHRKEINK